MKKKITLISIFLCLFIYMMNAQENKSEKIHIHLQGRYVETTGWYPRLDAHMRIYKKTGINFGYGTDGVSLGYIELNQELFPWLSIVGGTGFHYYQDLFHPMIGILAKKEFSQYEILGHTRVFFNHMTHLGLEIEALRKLHHRVSIGMICEGETGKEFMRNTEAKELYIPKTPKEEKIFLFGPSIKCLINNHFSLIGSLTGGVRIKEKMDHIYSINLGISFTR